MLVWSKSFFSRLVVKSGLSFRQIFSPARCPTSRFNPGRMKQKAYAAAGVDLDLSNKVKATMPQLLASTHRREVLGKVGGSSGIFQLDLKKYREPNHQV